MASGFSLGDSSSDDEDLIPTPTPPTPTPATNPSDTTTIDTHTDTAVKGEDGGGEGGESVAAAVDVGVDESAGEQDTASPPPTTTEEEGVESTLDNDNNNDNNDDTDEQPNTADVERVRDTGKAALRLSGTPRDSVTEEDLGELFEELLTSYDSEGLRSAVAEFGVPDSHRGRVWQLLLGVAKKSDPTRAWNEDVRLPEQDEIHADASLCAPPITLRVDPEEFVRDLETMLTVYCQTRSIAYKRGLSRLAFPFLASGLDRGAAFNCFYALTAKYLPVLAAGIPEAAACNAAHFRLLLRYHDPELCSHLDSIQANISNLVDPWLIRLFSSCAELPALFALWDRLFAEGDPISLYFFVLAFLVKKRATVMLTNKGDVGRVLGKLRLNTPSEVLALSEAAAELDRNTPKSFRQQLFSTLFHGKKLSPSVVGRHAASAESAVCLSVSATEIVTQCHVSSEDVGSVKFFVMDTRRVSEYTAGHLPTAFSVDLDAVQALSSAFDSLVAEFRNLQGDHLCFLGHDDGDPATLATIMQFVRRGFPYVSILQGGFVACHELEGVELAEHKPELCVVCTPPGSEVNEESSEESKVTAQERLKKSMSVAEANAKVAQQNVKAKFGAFSSFLKSAGNKAKQSLDNTMNDLAGPAGASGSGSRSRSASNADEPSTESATPTTPASTGGFSLDDEADGEGVNSGEKGVNSAGAPPETATQTQSNGKASAAEEAGPSEDTSEFPIQPTLALNDVVVVEGWMNDPRVYVYHCSAVSLKTGRTAPRYLFISPQVMVSVMAHKSRMGVGLVQTCHRIERLKRLTFMKKNENVIKLGFLKSADGPEDELVWLAFLMTDAQATIKTIKTCLSARKAELKAARVSE